MKEINDIVQAYEVAHARGMKTALATVVHVEGSSYRRPGARMLVTEEGQLTGAISGGCLEGDALRKALLAIAQGTNKLVTYDTTDEDDARFGVQLGCNGIVHILFEPLLEQQHAITLLRQLVACRQNAVLVTLFSLTNNIQPGTSLLHREAATDNRLEDPLAGAILPRARAVLSAGSSAIESLPVGEGALNAFLQFVPPPVAVVIAGAGNDVQPLVELAATLGWDTTVVDGRPTHATAQRFARAQTVRVAKPPEVLRFVHVDEHTVFLLMTHNYNYDVALLKELLPHPCPYIGVLGPKKKMERMWSDLRAEGIVPTAAQMARVHSPVGLDIGAETPEEIAISIVAEIKAVLSSRRGGSLRDKQAPIHSTSS